MIADQDVTLADILGIVPSEMKPLLLALFAEVERLALRATDLAQQNEWLRKRAPILAAAKAERDANGP